MVHRMRGGSSSGGGDDGDDGDPKDEVVLVVMMIIFEKMRSLEHMSSAAKTSSRLGVCQSTD